MTPQTLPDPMAREPAVAERAERRDRHGRQARRRARRRLRALVGGLALASAWLLAAPGLGLATVVAGLVGCAAIARRGLARLLRRRAREAPVGMVAVEIASIVVVAVGAVSWAHTVAQPSNSSLPIRTVEWLRDQGGAGLVSRVERVYYSLTAPAKGGAALGKLPSVGLASGSTAPHTPHVPARRVHHRRRAFVPARVRSVIHPALRGEGTWRPTQGRFAHMSPPPVLVTAYRPTPDYPRIVVGLAWFDHRHTRVSLYPGLREPPVGGARGGAEVPPASRGALLATFNSGFKHKDGNGGFFVAGRLLEPMVTGQGTIIGMTDGRVDVRRWTGGPRPAAGVAFARQNLPLIVDRGQPNPNLSDGPQWGATVGNAILVWRSGVGVDRHGNLLYAAGPDLDVAALARTLIHAGAVRAVELDINSYWVTLNTYALTGARDARQLLPSMHRSAQRYLTPDDRDFFAVYVR